MHGSRSSAPAARHRGASTSSPYSPCRHHGHPRPRKPAALPEMRQGHQAIAGRTASAGAAPATLPRRRGVTTLIRRRDAHRPGCCRICYGDVRVGAISERTSGPVIMPRVSIPRENIPAFNWHRSPNATSVASPSSDRFQVGRLRRRRLAKMRARPRNQRTRSAGSVCWRSHPLCIFCILPAGARQPRSSRLCGLFRCLLQPNCICQSH